MNHICQPLKVEKKYIHKEVYPRDYTIINFMEKHFKKQYYMEFDNCSLVLAPKRGNKAHDYRVRGRVWDIEKRLKKISYIDPEKGLSNLLHLTITYPDTHESWEVFSQDTKHFLDSMRKDKYIGMTDYVITLEATKKGVAHAHILVSLENPVKFVMSRDYNPRTKTSRKFGKIADFEMSSRIISKWKNRMTAEACYSHEASYYVFKYVSKGFTNVEAVFKKYRTGQELSDAEFKTLIGLYSLVLHKKRAFRVSRGYKKTVWTGNTELPREEPLDHVQLRAEKKCKDYKCAICQTPCFSSLVIREAQLRKGKSQLTGFYHRNSIQNLLFGGLPADDIVKAFRYVNPDRWKSEIWRGVELIDVEIYK